MHAIVTNLLQTFDGPNAKLILDLLHNKLEAARQLQASSLFGWYIRVVFK